MKHGVIEVYGDATFNATVKVVNATLDGAMIYQDATNGLLSSGVYWDSDNSRMGVGISTPATTVQVNGSLSVGSQTTDDFGLPLFVNSESQTFTLFDDLTTLSNINAGFGRRQNITRDSGIVLTSAAAASASGENRIYFSHYKTNDASVSKTGLQAAIIGQGNAGGLANGGYLRLQGSSDGLTLSDVARVTGTEFVINPSSTSIPLRAAGDTATHLLCTDPATDRVGINNATPDVLFHVETDSALPTEFVRFSDTLITNSRLTWGVDDGSTYSLGDLYYFYTSAASLGMGFNDVKDLVFTATGPVFNAGNANIDWQVNWNSGTSIFVLGSDGSVSFVDSAVTISSTAATFTGDLTVDTDTLHVDSVTSRIGFGTVTPHAQVQFSNVQADRRMVLYESADNDHEFYGFGTPVNTLRYQVPIGATHRFYEALTSTTSQSIMRIGDGKVVINDEGADIDFQVESVGLATTLYNNAATARTGFGTSSPSHPIHVKRNGETQDISPVGNRLSDVILQIEPLSTTGEDCDIVAIGHRNNVANSPVVSYWLGNYDNDTGTTHYIGQMCGEVTNTTDNHGDLIFYTFTAGLLSGRKEALRLVEDGDVEMAYNLKVEGSEIDFTNLPTSDPLVAGRLWNNSGVLTVSAG